MAADREEGGSNLSISRYVPHKECRRHKKIHCGRILTPQQIQCYFSWTAKIIKNSSTQPNPDQYDLMAAEEEPACHCSQEMVLSECQLVHPIIYDNHNVCQLFSKGKLKKLTIPVLHLICEYFHMDVESVTAKHKLPYITYLCDLVNSCFCSESNE